MEICEETLLHAGFHVRHFTRKVPRLLTPLSEDAIECNISLTRTRRDELDYAFPIGALDGVGCFLAADLLGLKRTRHE